MGEQKETNEKRLNCLFPLYSTSAQLCPALLLTAPGEEGPHKPEGAWMFATGSVPSEAAAGKHWLP